MFLARPISEDSQLVKSNFTNHLLIKTNNRRQHRKKNPKSSKECLFYFDANKKEEDEKFNYHRYINSKRSDKLFDNCRYIV